MRALTTVALLTLAFAAWGQAQDTGKAGTPKPAVPGRRAPLANPDDVEPAVDVGAQRVALIDRPSTLPPSASPPADASAAPSEPAQGAASAAPATAAAPQSATPSAASAASTARPPRSSVLDTLDLGTTSITGNQELPKVLYIVPWKKSDLGDLVGRPVNTLLDEVLEPVDPEVFERHLNYYEALYGKGHKEKE